MKSKISVIVACRGRLHHLKQSLPTIAGKPQIEYVLIDDNCPDGSGQWAKSLCPDITLIELRDAEYFNISRLFNMGAIKASGEILFFVGADVLFGAEFATDLLRQFNNENEALILNDGEGECGIIAVTRDKFMHCGGYNEEFEGYGWEDHDLRSRLQKTGVAMRRVTLPLQVIHHGDDDRIKHMGPARQNKIATNEANALRSQQESVRPFMLSILNYLSNGAPGGGSLQAETIQKLLSWKNPRTVLELPNTADPKHRAHIVHESSCQPETKVITLEDSAEKEGFQRFDLVILDGAENWEQARNEFLIALTHAADDAFLIWPRYKVGSSAVDSFVNAISGQRIFFVERSSVAFIRLRASLRSVLIETAKAVRQPIAESKRNEEFDFPGQKQRLSACRFCPEHNRETGVCEKSDETEHLKTIVKRINASCPLGYWGPGASWKGRHPRPATMVTS